MKKIIALVLALCMVFAIAAVAHAEEDIGDTLVLYSTMTEKDLEAAYQFLCNHQDAAIRLL